MNIDPEILHFWYFVIAGGLLYLFAREARLFLTKRYEFRFYEMQFNHPEQDVVSMPQREEGGIHAAD